MSTAPDEHGAAIELQSREYETRSALWRLAQLWDEQLALGTSQDDGRQYDVHCAQHREARGLLRVVGIRNPDGE